MFYTHGVNKLGKSFKKYIIKHLIFLDKEGQKLCTTKQLYTLFVYIIGIYKLQKNKKAKERRTQNTQIKECVKTAVDFWMKCIQFYKVFKEKVFKKFLNDEKCSAHHKLLTGDSFLLI